MFRLGGATYSDRREAGRRLAARLESFVGEDNVVLALPRGGVPVGYEVARALDAPLAALIVRKLGAPGNPELAIGALASDGTIVLDNDLIAHLGIRGDYVQAEIDRQRAEIARRLDSYGVAFYAPPLEGRTVIVVDDGIATGSTVEAALRALREREPRWLVLAVPVGPRAVLQRLEDFADEIIADSAPDTVFGVGAWYADFAQVSDEEVVRLLRELGNGEGDDRS